MQQQKWARPKAFSFLRCNDPHAIRRSPLSAFFHPVQKCKKSILWSSLSFAGLCDARLRVVQVGFLFKPKSLNLTQIRVFARRQNELRFAHYAAVVSQVFD